MFSPFFHRYYEEYANGTVVRAIDDINAMDKHNDELRDLKIAYIDCNIGSWNEYVYVRGVGANVPTKQLEIRLSSYDFLFVFWQ